MKIKIGDIIYLDLGGMGPAKLTVLNTQWYNAEEKDLVLLKYDTGKLITLTKQEIKDLK